MRRVFPIKTSLAAKEEYYSEFRKILSNAINETLNKILGKNAAQTIYFHLEQEHHLKREDIPDNLEDFQFVLEKIFGIGALLIEKAIMENLYSCLSLENKKNCINYENQEQFNFVNYVSSLKKLTIGPRKRHVSNIQYDHSRGVDGLRLHWGVDWNQDLD